MAPVVVYTAIRAFRTLKETTHLRDKLEKNTAYFRRGLVERGFGLKEGTHPIVPIMLGDERLAHDMARDLLNEGIYVIGFSYPVVPRGEARIRVQISAAHEKAHLDRALEAFSKVGRKLGVIAA